MFKYTLFSFALFLVGMLGIFITRKNIIIILMSIELMLLAINVNFICYSVYLDDLVGQVFALFVVGIFRHNGYNVTIRLNLPCPYMYG